jgi:HEAT repeat protein
MAVAAIAEFPLRIPLQKVLIFLTKAAMPGTTDTMPDLKTAQDMMATALAAKETADPEITSVKQLLKLLDKTAKSSRTYGINNPVAQNFFLQLHHELTTHLSTYSRLLFLVQRSELHFRDEVVYRSEQDASNENIAFKLYADGIRELAFYEGLTPEDLTFFLEALWDSGDSKDDDEDIVTRLWDKNLSTVQLVTAEEIAKSSGDRDAFSAPESDLMNAPTTSLRDILDHERAKQQQEQGGAKTQGSGPQKAGRLQPGLVGYEITEEEVARLAHEIEVESTRDSALYVLDILTAILASETQPDRLSKQFELWNDVLGSLTQQGKWTLLENVLTLLHEAGEVRPDLTEGHRQQLSALFDELGHPDRIRMIESYLNGTPTANTEGLSTILLMMRPTAVPALCSLLAGLESPSHQTIVSEVLLVLAKEQPEPILRGLLDHRPVYVRNLLAILMRWNNPRFAEAVDKLMRHPDTQVRKDAVRTLGLLRPSGNGTKLIAFMADAEESVRMAALKLLMSGKYTAPFTAWSSIVSTEEFADRNLSERRAVFQAIRSTSGDEAVPFWQNLLTDWSWTNRKKKEDLALLAAETLGKLATPTAIAALEHGQKKAGSAVRQACAVALAQAEKQRNTKQAPPLSK